MAIKTTYCLNKARLGCLPSGIGYTLREINTGGNRVGAEDLPICMFPEPKLKAYYTIAA